MKEYQKIFEHLQKVSAHHRFEADVCDQNILLIESILSAIEDLNERVERIERESPYDTPEDLSDCRTENKDLKKRLETVRIHRKTRQNVA